MKHVFSPPNYVLLCGISQLISSLESNHLVIYVMDVLQYSSHEPY